MFAIEIPGNDHAAAVDVLAQVTRWHTPPGRQYQTAEADLSSPLLEGATRAFFIRMRPGDRVHRHRDPHAIATDFDTDHIVVTTNDRAYLCWNEHGNDHAQHLEHGKRYRIRDRGLLHWAVNDGQTDRIHLLIEYRRRV